MILSSREAETRSPAALNAAMRRQANGTRLSVGFILTRRFTLCAFANFIDVLRPIYKISQNISSCVSLCSISLHR